MTSSVSNKEKQKREIQAEEKESAKAQKDSELGTHFRLDIQGSHEDWGKVERPLSLVLFVFCVFFFELSF